MKRPSYHAGDAHKPATMVMKFGGTSVQDASRLVVVASLICDKLSRLQAIVKRHGGKTKAIPVTLAVVLSAMKGTTDDLLETATLAQEHGGVDERPEKEGSGEYRRKYHYIVDRHTNAWKQLSGSAALPPNVDEALRDLGELLHGIAFVKECTPRTRDLIVSFGERLSCMMLTAYIKDYCRDATARCDVQYVDARTCIITNDTHGEVSVKFDNTYKNIKQCCTPKGGKDSVNIITGFIGATPEGVTTTLGRNGSDYTASLVGAALDADSVEIWTDVDGVLSADPRIVSDAFVIPCISYSEAMELSYFGARVIHPQSIVPLQEKGIDIVIKNTLNPTAAGTVIKSEKTNGGTPVTGIASTTCATMLTVEGAGLSGNFYFLPRIFNVFANHHIQPIMISQSSSEHSICFMLQDKDAKKITQLLKDEFSKELKQKRIQNISTMSDVSIISLIGVRMRGTTGLSGRVFHVMGKAGVNVIAIAQGSNEINISFVVKRGEEQHAIHMLHNEFFSGGRISAVPSIKTGGHKKTHKQKIRSK